MFATNTNQTQNPSAKVYSHQDSYSKAGKPYANSSSSHPNSYSNPNPYANANADADSYPNSYAAHYTPADSGRMECILSGLEFRLKT